MMNKDKIIFSLGIVTVIVGSVLSICALHHKKLYNIRIKNKETLQSEYTSIDERLTTIENNFLDRTYPVGSIYMSISEDTVEKVQEKFGGSWKKIEGRFLLSSSSSYAAGSTGGSADAIVVSHSHTFTGTAATSGGPSANPTYKFTGTRAQTEAAGGHSHTIGVGYAKNEAKSNGIVKSPTFMDRIIVIGRTTTSSTAANHTHNYTPKGSVAISGNSSHTHSVTAKGTVGTKGESGTGKNMPPYLVVHMYERTS